MSYTKSIEKMSPPPAGNQIEKLFTYYDRYCFERGIQEIIQRSKAAARRYTDELVIMNYELKIIEEAITLSIKDYPLTDDRKQVVFKVPPLTTILNYCKKLTRKKNQPIPQEEKTLTLTKLQIQNQYEKAAKEGNQWARNHLERNFFKNNDNNEAVSV